jgi:hypothetical protein
MDMNSPALRVNVMSRLTSSTVPSAIGRLLHRPDTSSNAELAAGQEAVT